MNAPRAARYSVWMGMMHAVGGGEGVDHQQAQRGVAVDEDEVVMRFDAIQWSSAPVRG